jgi:molybdopterin-binding protein
VTSIRWWPGIRCGTGSPGLVTSVVRDAVMAQVEIQAGPYRFVSLLSREAADELGLEPGMLALAAVKAMSVCVEIPASEWIARSPAAGSARGPAADPARVTARTRTLRC